MEKVKNKQNSFYKKIEELENKVNKFNGYDLEDINDHASLFNLPSLGSGNSKAYGELGFRSGGVDPRNSDQICLKFI